jgi:hypothetical protein
MSADSETGFPGETATYVVDLVKDINRRIFDVTSKQPGRAETAKACLGGDEVDSRGLRMGINY